MPAHITISAKVLSYLCFVWERCRFYSLSVAFYLTDPTENSTAATRVIRIQDGDDAKRVLQAQWNKDREERFILRLPFRDIHILPNHYLSDYGWKTDDYISSNIDLRERVLGRWTLLGSLTPMQPGDRTHSAVAFIKDSMTGNMSAWTAPVHHELNYAINAHMGNCPNWQAFSAYELGISLNLQVYERVFVGLDLCKHDDWSTACKEYSNSAISTAAKLMEFAWWQRPLIAPFVAEYKDLKSHIAKMQALLDPILRTKLSQWAPKSSPEAKDFIDWWIEKSPEAKREDSYALTVAMIQLNIAGIRSTTMVLMQALFDLATRVEYTDPILAELDQRHVAQNLLSIYRKVMSPLRLKDGSLLPTGSYVAVQSIDSEARPGHTTREFDGFKWARLRAKPGDEHKSTAVASGMDSLEFGYGVHVCPGRFFANYTVKATLAAILRRYELRLPPGKGIPKAHYNSLLVLIPPTSQEVEFRARN
ncbi:MAG: hypothetical protein Q9219_006053 [cf. Caloplaca sp. 3 TL-2023]